MSFLDILWLFLIFSALQPVLAQRLLEAKRYKVLSIIERKRKSRVITLIHRQETMSFFGVPIFRYIDINDSEEIIRVIHNTPDDTPIDLILHTPGGLVLAAVQIAYALMRHKAKVTVFVPFYAMSGGTFIALSADEIVMGEHALLGPVDPQLGQYPAVSIIKAVKQKNVNDVDDKTLILSDVAQKALSQVETQVCKLLKRNQMPEEKAKELARTLSSGKWTHDYPITFEDARNLGLPVTSDMPEEVYELMALHPQPLRREPSVEYLPFPVPGRNIKRIKE